MKIAFIGCGNMGGAILDGILSSSLYKKEDIFVCVSRKESALRINEEKKVYTTLNAVEILEDVDVILLAIKPQKFAEVIPPLAMYCKNKLIISVAAGITITQIQNLVKDENAHVVRAMPNTPACVKAAMSSLSYSKQVTTEEKKVAQSIFSSFGKIVEVEEEQIHGIISMSGSSPAYVFMLLHAMVEFGMKHGFSKEEAMDLAGQAVLGSAKMLLETHEDPERMKKNVCSPGGTTIEAVHSFEQDGFYEMIEKGMEACYQKSIWMSKK